MRTNPKNMFDQFLMGTSQNMLIKKDFFVTTPRGLMGLLFCKSSIID